MGGNLSYAKIAEKWGVSVRQVEEHGRKNHWTEKRREFRGKVAARAEQKAIDKRASREAEKLARLAGFSPKYFCRCFRAILHRSPIDYLNHYRIECASHFLTASDMTVAKIAQYAENVYFGKPCGLMDQMASSVGNIITIDFASPAKPVVEPVAVDFSKAGLALCILDSGADHADLTDEYAAIPAECRAVAAVCGGEVLRDVPFETFLAKLPECRRQCGDRAVLRAFHVYADNDRVAKQVAALHDGDFDTFLCLVNESGCSSWEYLQNVIPAGYKEHQEVGVTIAAAKHLLGDKGAVRVHGGGFAGTVQAFVPVEMLDEFKAGMEAILGEGRCHVLSIRPEGGAVL